MFENTGQLYRKELLVSLRQKKNYYKCTKGKKILNPQVFFLGGASKKTTTFQKKAFDCVTYPFNVIMLVLQGKGMVN